MIDPHAKIYSRKGTFGGSPAAINLDKILNELNDSTVFYKVGQYFESYRFMLKQCNHIPEQGYKRTVINIMGDRLFEKIRGEGFPSKVESHLINALSTMRKELYREIDPTGKFGRLSQRYVPQEPRTLHHDWKQEFYPSIGWGKVCLNCLAWTFNTAEGSPCKGKNPSAKGLTTDNKWDIIGK